MYNANKPSTKELPASGQLLRSTVIAIVAAAAILVTAVLPSEYGIDPTGAGRLLGLAGMGEIKMQLAAEAAADRQAPAGAEIAPSAVAPQVEAKAPASVQAAPVKRAAAAQVAKPGTRSDEISITLSPGEGTEVKLVMKAGAKARFEWTANGGLLNYDTHGDGGGKNTR